MLKRIWHDAEHGVEALGFGVHPSPSRRSTMISHNNFLSGPAAHNTVDTNSGSTLHSSSSPHSFLDNDLLVPQGKSHDVGIPWRLKVAGGGGHDDAPKDPDAAAKATFKTCIIALIASTAAFMNAFVGYKMDLHREHEKEKEKGKRPTCTGLATSWHHFTWPPPQHQATQTTRGEFGFGRYGP
eukprot:gnl/MRDRNA2_/MRDRNA2_81818_c0_seq3.p1 gnl/MRDRNA2_/MRDRNA2_81818_c0~~gnl/MRDRNA2_/MRDRNA2_81818_c0_seq3.p1  ORF type:complete len:183 (-),score=25.62 gnl/MRDRNA2_/MRDRNA2_81818_c0_seq3:683-1231(-)